MSDERPEGEPAPPANPATAAPWLPGASSESLRLPLMILVVLAVVYSLAIARDVLLPIMLAFLASIVLRPAVQSLVRIRIPRSMATVFIMLVVAGIFVGGFMTLAQPVTIWLDRLPQLMWKIEYQFAPLRSSIEEAQEISEQVSNIAEPAKDVERVVVEGPSVTEQALLHLQDVSVTLVVTVVLLFFLLAQGQERLQRVVAALPERSKRSQWASALTQMRSDITVYLRTITLINLCVGIATAAAMAAIGLPDPILWGVLAAVANFLPYVGPLAVGVLIAAASLLVFDNWLLMLLPPLAFLLITGLEGHFLTPMILGRRLLINPIAVFVAVLFWSWIWGLPGALLAVPMLTLLKIVCDNVDSLTYLRPLLR